MIFQRETLLLLLVNTVYFFIIMNATLMTFGVRYSYLVFICVLLVVLSVGRLDSSKLKLFLPHLIYLLFIFISLCVTIIFLNGDSNSFVSFGLYFLPIIVWILFYSNVHELAYWEVYKSTFYLSSIVGYLGVIQFFISPTLFGLIPTNSMAFDWVLGKSFTEYSGFFRATSTLGSPQVFGLFCALNLILSFRYKSKINQKVFLAGVFGLGLGGALSGNKSFYLIIILYFLIIYYKRVFTNSKVAFFILGTLLVATLNSKNIIDKVPMLERVLSVESVMEQENENSDSRISRYLYILSNANPLIGEGLGKITNKSIEGLRAPESYFLKIYYEAGALVMLMFILLCYFSYKKAKAFDSRDGLIVALTVLGMVIVHAFESPAFFIVWGHLLGSFILTERQRGSGEI